MKPTNDEKRQIIKDLISDLVSDFLYYRKSVEEWPRRGDIEDAVADGIIDREYILMCFGDCIRKRFSKDIV